MKRFMFRLLIMVLAGVVWAGTVSGETVCFDIGSVVVSNRKVSDSEVIKALELAVKHTELKNTDNQYMGMGFATTSIGHVMPSETKAQEMRRKAKEALDEAERKAKSLEQHDKDIQFIRDILEKLRGSK